MNRYYLLNELLNELLNHYSQENDEKRNYKSQIENKEGLQTKTESWESEGGKVKVVTFYYSPKIERESLEELEKHLQQLVIEEKYEEAAQVRDQIKLLKKGEN